MQQQEHIILSRSFQNRHSILCSSFPTVIAMTIWCAQQSLLSKGDCLFQGISVTAKKHSSLLWVQKLDIVCEMDGIFAFFSPLKGFLMNYSVRFYFNIFLNQNEVLEWIFQVKILCHMIEDLVISRCDKMSTTEYENLLLRIEIHFDERHLIMQTMFNSPLKKKKT